jgi:hypothetical protein
MLPRMDMLTFVTLQAHDGSTTHVARRSPLLSMILVSNVFPKRMLIISFRLSKKNTT